MEEKEIPKIIHYCWFGGKEKPKIVLDCIESWKRLMPEYEIIEWNENNFDINSFEYTKKAFNEKKWAFISDVARLVALEKMGGIYLDTDMYVLRKFDDFLEYDFFLGMEDKNFMNVAIFGSKKGSEFSKRLLAKYHNLKNFETIPRIVTEVFNQLNPEEKSKIKLFSKNYFYPFTADNIKKFNYHNAPVESYAVHLWNYSWGHPLNRFLKKTRIHKKAIKFSEKLKIKNTIKKLLKMP